MYEILDWSKLPADLGYLAAPAEKYGRFQFDDKIIAFLRQMTESQKLEITLLLHRTAKDCDQMNAWLDMFPITEHPEARLVYFLSYLLVTANDDGYLGNPTHS